MRRIGLAWVFTALGLIAASAHAADTVYYYSSDIVHSEVVITDASRNVVERTYYAPYGQVLNRDLRDGPGYGGHEEDPETNLVYMQQRYYDPEAGRFLSTDSVQADGGGGSFNRYEYANDNPYRYTDPDGRKTTCTGSGKDQQCTITADTYNPATSTHQTIVAGPPVKEAAEQGKSVVAVHSGSQEKLGFVVQGSDGKLSVQSASDTKTGETATGSTASATIPSDAVAGIHGHIDSGPNQSNGMVDDPKSNGNYGDTQSLKAGIPMATVSQGQVGWHEMQNGQLQFSYPGGALNGSQSQQMQSNLNVEQLNFQQPQQ
jgi:RHS repeat-associated protein